MDGTIKLTRQIDDANKLSLSFYSGSDHFLTRAYYKTDAAQNQGIPFEVNARSDIKWGNRLGALKWQRQISPRWYQALLVSFTQFSYLNKNSIIKSNLSPAATLLEFKNSFTSDIKDFSANLGYEYAIPESNNLLRFGVQGKKLFLNPNLTSFFKKGEAVTTLDTTLTSGQQRAAVFSIYTEWQFNALKRLNGNIGLRSSVFNTGQKRYFSLQPRLSLAYRLIGDLQLKSSFSQMQQNLHLLSNSGVGLPTDLWVTSTDKVAPQKSWMVSLGLQKYFARQKVDLEIDVYYKKFKHLISFGEGASFFTGSADWQQKVKTGGRGTAYGVEFLLRKEVGKNTGWIAYTLSWNNRQFDNINHGLIYPFRYDRRHDFSIVFQREISKNIFFSGSWVFQSGAAMTLPTRQFKTYNLDLERDYINDLEYSTFASYDFHPTYYYEARNNFRIPSYHRLDINFRFEKDRKRGKRIWNLGLYNLYSRLNPFYLYFDTDKSGKIKLNSFSIFPILPSISFQRVW